MNRTPDNPYPNEDCPWNFYFNGVLMPKWSACWAMARIPAFLKPEDHWDEDVSDRDTYIIYCSIDHVGTPESADPGVLIYAVQEVLCILLGHREKVMESISTNPLGCDALAVYQGLVSGALQMRHLASEHRLAFWTSGYEEDRLRLLQSMKRTELPPSHPDHQPAPHQARLACELVTLTDLQRSRLHQLAQSGRFDQDLRTQLHAI
jgi:hypothetical protein